MKWLSEIAVSFFVRMIVGITIIFFVNYFLASNEIPISVGINPISVVTSGVLGVPGVCLLYGIVCY